MTKSVYPCPQCGQKMMLIDLRPHRYYKCYESRHDELFAEKGQPHYYTVRELDPETGKISKEIVLSRLLKKEPPK